MPTFGLGNVLVSRKSIIPLVSSLPADASTKGSPLGYDRYNHITATAIPSVLNQRYVLESAYGNKQVRGAVVAELNGPDTLICPIQSGDLVGAGTWKVSFTYLDAAATYTTSAQLVTFRNASNTVMLKLQCFNSGKYVFGITNGSTVVRYVTSAQNQTQQLPTRVDIEYTGSALVCTINGEAMTITDVTGWTTYTGCKDFLFSDTQTTIRPLQISDVTVYRAGVLTDYWSCNAGTGTSVANSVTPSRPATLSDAAAWGQGYIIEAAIEKWPWRWLGAVWERVWGYIFNFANLDFTDPALPGWDRLYTDEDNFTIVDLNSEKFVQFSLSPLELWTSPDTGGQTARAEIRLLDSGNHGSTYLYAFDVIIDNAHGESATWTVMSQFHDNPDKSINESWTGYVAHSPNISLKYQSGNLRVGVVDDFSTGHVTDIIAVPFSKGVIHHIEMKIKWSLGTDGTLEVWLDGVALEAAGQTKYTARNCFNQGGVYFRVGIYRDPTINALGRISFSNVTSRIV